MSALPFSVRPSTPVEQAARLLATNKMGSLSVVENGKLVGITTATDLLHEAILGSAVDGSVRIDLDVAGSGEISATISLVHTICQVLCIGTYSRKAPGRRGSICASSWDRRPARITHTTAVRL
jgi:hypothetical protein